MTSSRRVASSLSIFNHRSVVVQETDGHGTWCPCTLSLGLNRTKEPRLGNIVLRQLAHFEGFDGEHPVSLRLPPENIEGMHHEYGDAKNIPSDILSHFAQNNPIRPTGQVLTLVLDMSAYGCVIVPSTATVLTPKRDCRRTVLAFQRLCQATKLLIYVPADHVTELQMAELREFNLLACQGGALTSMPVNLRRMYGGTGAREASWEVFNVVELPPAYSQQAERATNKRSREASPILTPKRHATDFSRPSAYVSNTDTDTDFSTHAFSPLLASRSPTGINTATRKEPSIPISTDVDLVHSAMQSMVHDALPNIVEKTLSEMLPTVLRTTVQDMLPQMLYDVICELRPGIQKSRASDASQSTTEQDRAGQHPLTGVMEPIVKEHLPAVVRKVIDDDGTYDDLIYQAQQQMEMVIEEERDNALDQVREERDICVRDVQETGTNVRDMLESTGWDMGGERSPQTILQAIIRTVRSTVSGESAQSDLLRFTRTPAERRRSVSGESTEDGTSTTDKAQTGGSLSTRVSFSSAHDDSTEAEADNEGEDGQVEGNLSLRSTHNLSPSASSPPSRASTAGAQVQVNVYGQSPSGSVDTLRNAMSVEGGEIAPGEEDCKEWQYFDLSPTQADTDMDVTDLQGKGNVEGRGDDEEFAANTYGRTRSVLD